MGGARCCFAAAAATRSTGWTAVAAVPRRSLMSSSRTLTAEQDGPGEDVLQEAPYIVMSVSADEIQAGPRKQKDILAIQDETPTFDPKELKTDLLRTLNLEEMYHRGKNREHPMFYPGSIVRVTYKESRTRSVTKP